MTTAAPIIVVLLFALSGASGLCYEVLWERTLRLSFGVSIYSVAVVTAAFMAGLSLGYAAGRSRRLEAHHPLRVYAAAEAGIALYALAFPWLHATVDAADLASGGVLALRVALALLLLLPPTVLMGVTLPVGSRWLAGRLGAGKAAAWLLAANTAGGVAGALLTGWLWLRIYGAATTMHIALGINILAALWALAISLRAPPKSAEAETPETAPPAAPLSEGERRWIAAAAFVAGIQTMAPQVVWNRTLVCVVENNTTSFSLILASVLLGSALGAAAYGVLAPRAPSRGRLLALFFGAQVFFALWVLASIPVLNRLYDVAHALSALWPVRSVLDLCLVRWAVALVPVAPAAAAGAFLLPLLTDLRAPRGAMEGGRAVSAVLSADALGSVAGALATGFVLVPAIGLGRTLLGVAILGLAAGVALLVRFGADRRRSLAFGGTAALAAVSAAVVIAWTTPLTLTRWYDGHQGVRGDLKYYHEGLSGTIAVFEVDGRKELLINCIEEVPNHRDAMLLFKLLGHAPLLLHGEPKRVLVNALGGGITLGAVLQHGAETEAVELVPEVRDAMGLFAEENNNAAERTDWRLVADDGRNYLRLASGSYDVITADSTHPAAGESWPLYTREYYRIVRAHLRPGGLFAQWLPLHNLVEADFLAVLRTFREGFPSMVVLFANRYCVLIGGAEAPALDADLLGSRIAARREVAEDLRPYGIENGRDLLKYLVLEGEGVDRLAGHASVLTDDHASVEFAELDRLGIPETFSMDLAVLLRGFDAAALARRTGLGREVFEARRALLSAALDLRAAEREGRPMLEATFKALVALEGARERAAEDADVEVAIATLQDQLLRTLASDYAEILARRDLAPLVEIFHYAAELHPGDPFLNQLLGAAFLRLERWNDAIPYLERAAAARPADFTFQSNLAFAYAQARRYPEALATLQGLDALDPGNAAVARFRARVEEAMGGGKEEP